MPNKHLHYISLVVGIIFWLPSVILAVFFHYHHFYTAFAFGGWLILDFIDWKLTGKSILAFFYSHENRRAFLIFFIFATIFCFVVDYIYGVKISQMWQWIDYKTIHFIRMYLFMNASYVLGMYELWRVIRKLVSMYVIKRNNHQIENIPSKNVLWFVLVIGIIFMVLPLYSFYFDASMHIEYIMIFPFMGMLLMADSFTGLLGGHPTFVKITHFNSLYITSAIFTVILGAFFTEFINVFGGEWKYIKIPFPELNVFHIPVAVFIGWVPLVLGSIAIVHFIKQLSYRIVLTKSKS